MQFLNVEKGIKKIIFSQIMSILSELLSTGTMLLLNVTLMFLSREDNPFVLPLILLSGFIGLFTMTAMTLTVIFGFWGFFQASRDVEEFKKAMYCTVVVGLLTLIGAFFQISNGLIYTLLSSAGTIVEMFMMIYAISALTQVCLDCKRQDLKKRGDYILRFVFITCFISSINALIIRIFELSQQAEIVAIIVGAVSLLISLLQFIVFLGYLKQCAGMLKAYHANPERGSDHE